MGFLWKGRDTIKQEVNDEQRQSRQIQLSTTRNVNEYKYGSIVE